MQPIKSDHLYTTYMPKPKKKRKKSKRGLVLTQGQFSSLDLDPNSVQRWGLGPIPIFPKFRIVNLGFENQILTYNQPRIWNWPTFNICCYIISSIDELGTHVHTMIKHESTKLSFLKLNVAPH
jgi:hypothetical protein